MVDTQSYRWQLSPSFAAHLWKAVARQHHRELLPALARCIPHDAIVFDVGAHAGQFAKLFAALAVEGRVYAIEPGSYARAILRTAIGARRLNNVTVLPVALGAESRLETLHIPLKASGALGFGLSYFGAGESRWRRVATETVAQTTIDALAASFGLDRLDFIKADIEGSERRMLEGAQRTLERLRPCLLIELTEAHLARAGDTIADTFGFLAKCGYRAFALDARADFVPVAAPRDGDFWFLPAEHPLAVPG